MDLRQIMNWALISVRRNSKKKKNKQTKRDGRQGELTVLFLSRHFISGGCLRFG